MVFERNSEKVSKVGSEKAGNESRNNGTDNEAAPEAADGQSPLERARFGLFSWTRRCEVCGSA